MGKQILAPAERKLTLLVLLVVCGCRGEQLDPSDLLERGRYLSDMQRSAEAISLFDEVEAMQPNNAELFYLRGLAKERVDDLTGAIEDYSRAVDLNKGYSEAYNNRAVLRAQQGEYQPAVEDFTRVLRVSPRFTLGFKNRGLAYHDLGQFDQALADYNKAIELEPDSQGYFLRGNLRLEQKQYEAAVADYDQAIKLDDQNARAWLNRGMALSYLKDMLAARESLRRSAAIDNTIIAADVLDALQEVAKTTGTGLSFSEEKVQQALAATGWRVTPNNDELFRFKINRDGMTQRLCVVMLDRDSKKLSMSEEMSQQLLSDTSPKSLLIFSPAESNEEDASRFIENWQPKQDDVVATTVEVLIPDAIVP